MSNKYIDLFQTLQDWPYDPEKISVWKIQSPDRKIWIQMRIELGILQMAYEGRPDGWCPSKKCSSLLAYHQARLVKATDGFALTRKECHQLRVEASLYYRRYIALFVLEEFAEVVRDTEHSLAIFDVCAVYASAPEDKLALEEFRPYVLMMRARALAYQALEKKEAGSALKHIEAGMRDVRTACWNRWQSFLPDQRQQLGGSFAQFLRQFEELEMLRQLHKELEGKNPQSQMVATLREAFRAAVANEKYEAAAQLTERLEREFGIPANPRLE